jgi:gamma-glutamyltranspeptidase/glutathione hydrolase
MKDKTLFCAGKGLLGGALVLFLALVWTQRSGAQVATQGPMPNNRPIIRGSRMAVASRKGLASQAAMRLFERGGNAADAACAALATLGVVEPELSGIGGEVFMLVYDPAQGKVWTINGGGIAPGAATIARFSGAIPLYAPQSSVAPGAFDGWMVLLARFGRKGVADCLGDAIALARDGFAVSEEFAAAVAKNAPRLRAGEGRLYFHGDGRPYAVGERFRNPALAKLYQTLADTEQAARAAGKDRLAAIAAVRDSFYRGDVARTLTRDIRRQNGWLGLEDFAAYAALLEEPVYTDYHGVRIYKPASANQGPAELMALNILAHLPHAPPGSAQAIHQGAWAVDLAMTDRERYLGDLAFIEAPLHGLLSAGYAARRATLFDAQHRPQDLAPGDPAPFDAPYTYRPKAPLGPLPGRLAARAAQPMAPRAGTGEQPVASIDATSYVATTDASGLAVSATPSLFDYYGSGMVVAPYGFPMNNRLSYFHLDKNHPDALEPGKRPRNTITPSLALRNGRPYLIYGTPGADQQCQALMQFLVHVLDDHMDIQQAMDFPMWQSEDFPRSYGLHERHAGVLKLDARILHGRWDALRHAGWQLQSVPAYGNNRMAALRFLDNGIIEGAALSAHEGQALAW